MMWFSRRKMPMGNPATAVERMLAARKTQNDS
jgi:hypothetical protein